MSEPRRNMALFLLHKYWDMYYDESVSEEILRAHKNYYDATGWLHDPEEVIGPEHWPRKEIGRTVPARTSYTRWVTTETTSRGTCVRSGSNRTGGESQTVYGVIDISV